MISLTVRYTSGLQEPEPCGISPGSQPANCISCQGQLHTIEQQFLRVPSCRAAGGCQSCRQLFLPGSRRCQHLHSSLHRTGQSPYLQTFMEPRNRSRGIDSAILCSLAGRYDKQGCHTGSPGWESIHGLLKRFTDTGSGLRIVNSARSLCRAAKTKLIANFVHKLVVIVFARPVQCRFMGPIRGSVCFV